MRGKGPRNRRNTPLTPRQQEIYDLYRQGKTNQEIAKAIGVKHASKVSATLDIVLSKMGPGSQK